MTTICNGYSYAYTALSAYLTPAVGGNGHDPQWYDFPGSPYSIRCISVTGLCPCAECLPCLLYHDHDFGYEIYKNNPQHDPDKGEWMGTGEACSVHSFHSGEVCVELGSEDCSYAGGPAFSVYFHYNELLIIDTVYVDSVSGDDAGWGLTIDTPVQTLSRAYSLIIPTGLIHVVNNSASLSKTGITFNNSFRIDMVSDGTFTIS